MQLKKKTTGVTVDVVSPKILSPEEAVARDITASFVQCRTDDGEFIYITYGYKEDGTPSDKNEYELLTNKQEEISDELTDESTIH